MGVLKGPERSLGKKGALEGGAFVWRNNLLGGKLAGALGKTRRTFQKSSGERGAYLKAVTRVPERGGGIYGRKQGKKNHWGGDAGHHLKRGRRPSNRESDLFSGGVKDPRGWGRGDHTHEGCLEGGE